MSKAKRLLGALMAVLLAGTVSLTGCQNGNDSSQTPSTASKGDKASSAAPSGETVNVKWISGGETDISGAKPVYEEINKILKDKYNLQLTFETYPFGTYDEKMNMIINSGEAYDLCFTSQAWVNKYPAQVAKGAFLALDDYLADYPKLKEALPDFLFEQARINGKIYAVPNYQITYACWGFEFRKDIVDEMKAAGQEWDPTKEVKKYWDAEPYWKFVKDNHPELIPTNALFPTWNFENGKGNTYIEVENGIFFKNGDKEYKVFHPDLLSKDDQVSMGIGGWNAGVNNRKMWEKGYLREDIATITDESADIAAGRITCIAGTIKPGAAAERKKKSGNYDWIDVAIQDPFTTSVAARGAMTAVSAKSEHPKEALKMLEVMNTDKEVFNMLNFGIEGTNYNLVDGKVEQIDSSKYFYNSAWAVGNQFNALLMVNQEDGIWEQTDKINREAEQTPLMGYSFNNEKVTTEISSVDAVNKEYKNWEFQDDYETRWEQRVEKMKSSVEAVVAESQRQVDEFVAANKK